MWAQRPRRVRLCNSSCQLMQPVTMCLSLCKAFYCDCRWKRLDFVLLRLCVEATTLLTIKPIIFSCMQRVVLWERRNNTVEPFNETVQQVYSPAIRVDKGAGLILLSNFLVQLQFWCPLC